MAARVGLTGGIGSGKSTVASIFAKLGVKIIDADLVARELVTPGSSLLSEIIQVFGGNIVDDAGTLKRKALGEIVFADDSKRKWLEQLLHPEIRKRMDEIASTCEDPYCILEIPLLVETNRHEKMEQVIVVHCEQSIRQSRLIINRDMSRENIQSIMENQASDKQRLAVADHIIDNSGNLDSLETQVRAVHQKLIDYFAKK